MSRPDRLYATQTDTHDRGYTIEEVSRLLDGPDAENAVQEAAYDITNDLDKKKDMTETVHQEEQVVGKTSQRGP